MAVRYGSMGARLYRMAGRHGWVLTGCALAAAVVAVLPTAQIGVGAALLKGLVGSYLYEIDHTTTRNPSLAVAAINYPKGITLSWDYSCWDGNDFAPLGPPHYWLDMPDWVAPDPLRPQSHWGWTSESTYTDPIPLIPGRAYTYTLQAWAEDRPQCLDATGHPLPTPPPGANPRDIYVRNTEGGSTTFTFTPAQILASANQAVDSRLDLRFSENHPLDFQFANRVYRGGLFVGNAPDPSRVGRSFVQFQNSAAADGTFPFAADLAVNATRLAASGSVTVGAQRVSWDGDTAGLKWTSAPAFDPTRAPISQTFTWNQASPQSAWLNFGVADALGSVQGNGPLSFGLAATNEGSTGWAYLAKTEYDPNLGPRLLSVGGSPINVSRITFSSLPLSWGYSASGRVWLNGPAPAGGATVRFHWRSAGGFGWSSAGGANDVVVAAGQSSAAFEIEFGVPPNAQTWNAPSLVEVSALVVESWNQHRPVTVPARSRFPINANAGW